MPSKKSFLDTPVFQLWPKLGVNYVDFPAFGWEIELENCVTKPSDFHTRWWTMKGEASLRNNGQEFVTGVCHYDNRMEVAKDLRTILKEWLSTTPHLSIRCSTHMHLNIQYLTLRQVLHTALAWYLLENLIVRTQSDWRQGNLFCLRMTDAEAIGDHLLNVIESPTRFNIVFQKNSVKYSALNLAPVSGWGTMEWRFLGPMKDPPSLIFWTEIFQSLIEYGKDMVNVDQLLQEYENLNIKQLFHRIFGKANGQTLYLMVEEKYKDYAAMTRAIHKNYDIIFEIGTALRKKKYQLPEPFWFPDDENPANTAAISQMSGVYASATAADLGNLEINELLMDPPESDDDEY